MRLNKERFELFKEFIECVAVSGDERNMFKLLNDKYKDICDEILSDNLGSIVAHKKSKDLNAPKVLVLAHMDEVGLHVASILKDGSLLISDSRASIWSQTLMASKVYIQTRDNKLINGTIGTIPPHMLSAEMADRAMPISKMMVDIGAKTYEEAIELGINVFDPIVVRGELEELGNGERLLGKAFDNRYGCLLGYEVLKELKDNDLDIDLYVGCSVQEELGGSGAQAITNLVKPDFCIILDCSPAADMGGCNEHLTARLGEGVLLRVSDRTMIAVPELIQYQEEMCKKVNAKSQYFVSKGGTDAGVVHRSLDGVLTLTNCICARNIHTNASVIDLNDYEDSKKVLKGILLDLNKKKVDSFRPINKWVK